ncbi:hypothetical protein PR048_020538 [Dryococelus australis]|uniref:Solute carrier family 35 member F5 n=1 Tax=Dryococelus australis TaxID=614101 RepID=A0ABQ9H6J4_9NEOP|nr:hypothetical protein PR048_020538 [Dryococelus australis]
MTRSVFIKLRPLQATLHTPVRFELQRESGEWLSEAWTLAHAGSGGPGPTTCMDNEARSKRKEYFMLITRTNFVCVFPQYIYHNENYEKPFFSTYVKTSMFTIYLFGLCFWPPWRDQCTKPTTYMVWNESKYFRFPRSQLIGQFAFHQSRPGSVPLGVVWIFAYGKLGGRCCWLVCFLRTAHFPSPLHSATAPSSPCFTLTDSQGLAVSADQNLSPHLPVVSPVSAALNLQDGGQTGYRVVVDIKSDPTYVPIKFPEPGDKSSGTESDDSSIRSVRFSKLAEVRHMSEQDATEALLARLSYQASLRAGEVARRAAISCGNEQTLANLLHKLGCPKITMQTPISKTHVSDAFHWSLTGKQADDLRRFHDRQFTGGRKALIDIAALQNWFIANYTYQVALSDTEAGIVTVLSSTSSLFTLILAALFPSNIGDRFTLSKLVAVCISIAGLWVMQLHIHLGNALGNGLGVYRGPNTGQYRGPGCNGIPPSLAHSLFILWTGSRHRPSRVGSLGVGAITYSLLPTALDSMVKTIYMVDYTATRAVMCVPIRTGACLLYATVLVALRYGTKSGFDSIILHFGFPALGGRRNCLMIRQWARWQRVWHVRPRVGRRHLTHSAYCKSGLTVKGYCMGVVSAESSESREHPFSGSKVRWKRCEHQTNKPTDQYPGSKCRGQLKTGLEAKVISLFILNLGSALVGWRLVGKQWSHRAGVAKSIALRCDFTGWLEGNKRATIIIHTVLSSSV